MAGFCALVPESLLSIFDETELELLLFGVPELPVDEWKRCTVLSGGYEPGSAVIVWFWVMLENFTEMEMEVDSIVKPENFAAFQLLWSRFDREALKPAAQRRDSRGAGMWAACCCATLCAQVACALRPTNQGAVA